MEIPEKWKQKFFLVFWDEKEQQIILNEEQAQVLKAAIKRGAKYIELGVSLIPVSGIKMIKARYGYDNIPPFPSSDYLTQDNKTIEVESEQQKLWRNLYEKKDRVLIKKFY